MAAWHGMANDEQLRTLVHRRYGIFIHLLSSHPYQHGTAPQTGILSTVLMPNPVSEEVDDAVVAANLAEAPLFPQVPPCACNRGVR